MLRRIELYTLGLNYSHILVLKEITVTLTERLHNTGPLHGILPGMLS